MVAAAAVIRISRLAGTLKTFQWRPIDSNVPNKGMELFYENGASVPRLLCLLLRVAAAGCC